MKIKNKGKVHPSPSSSSSSSSASASASAASASHSSCGSATSRDVLSVLKLLPAAIFALATVLSLEDREVLAYMITRSLDTAAPAAARAGDGPGRKKGQPSKKAAAAAASAPSFDCDCFDCYGSYWHRWDSSPNRELIHQAIEAFEDHLASSELGKNKNGGGGGGGGRGKAKRRERDGRMARRAAASGQPQPEPEPEPEPEPQMPVIETAAPPEAEDRVAFPTENEASAAATPATSPERAGTENFPEEAELSRHPPPSPAVHDVAARRAPAAVSSHKGLARKVLPDVLGILNSRLWSLWSPNV